jgi:uncharacterized membrane protein YgdD (TMEM256/DUF423 family)
MKLLLVFGALSGFIAVAAGAFGAHALRDRLPPARLAAFETGARYQLPHAVAAVLAALLPRSRVGRAAGWCFLTGSIVFAGSLYTLALADVRAFGAVTPFGGAGLLAGWLLLAIAGWRTGVRRVAGE